MWKKQMKRLNRYHKTYGSFRVATHTSHGFWNYHPFPSLNATGIIKIDGMTDRQIMKDEIVIETDLPMRKMNNGIARSIERKLILHNWSYEKWFSGNKSYHIQMLFPELLMINESKDLQLLKKFFLLWLYNFERKNADKHKLDFGMAGNHLIRLEYSWHNMTGVRKRLISEHEGDDENSLPEIVWKKFSEYKNRVRNYPYKEMSMFDKKCMRYFFITAVPDCRKRVGFVLLSCLLKEFDTKTAIILFKDWNKNINSSYIDNMHESYMIDYHQSKEYTPRCNYIQGLLGELDKESICEGCRK